MSFVLLIIRTSTTSNSSGKGRSRLELAAGDGALSGSGASGVPPESGRVDVELERLVAGEGHGDVQVGEQALHDAVKGSNFVSDQAFSSPKYLNLHVLSDTTLTAVSHTVHPWATDEDGVSTEGNSLEDVGTSADARVEEDGHAALDGLDDLGEDVERGGLTVDLAPTVVGDDDTVAAVLESLEGVVSGQDTLQDDGAATGDCLRVIGSETRLVRREMGSYSLCLHCQTSQRTFSQM